MADLPSELLGRIAQEVSAGDTDTKSIIPMTHVCRSWREHLVLYSVIWTRISSESTEKLTDMALDRSKTVFLEACVRDEDTENQSRFIAKITPHFHKITALSVIYSKSDSSLTTCFKEMPSSLQELTLTLPYWYYREHKRFTYEPDSFPTTLKCLSLTNFPLFPSFSKIRTLTRFVLKDRYFDHSMDELLKFLAANGSLKSVSLDINFKEDNPISQDRPLIKNNFESLDITASTKTAKALLSRISLQRGIHLSIRATNGFICPTSFCFGFKSNPFVQITPFNQMEVKPRVIELSGPDGSFFSFDNPPKMFPSRDFPGYPRSEFPQFSYENIQHLRIRPYTDCLVVDPSVFPSLKTLIIEHWDGKPDLLSKLLGYPKSFPLLETVEFWYCDISDRLARDLVHFASELKNIRSKPLSSVTIVYFRSEDDQYLNAIPKDLVRELKLHVPGDGAVQALPGKLPQTGRAWTRNY